MFRFVLVIWLHLTLGTRGYNADSTADTSDVESAEERLNRIERVLYSKIDHLQNEIYNQNKIIDKQNEILALLRTKVTTQSRKISVLVREVEKLDNKLLRTEDKFDTKTILTESITTGTIKSDFNERVHETSGNLQADPVNKGLSISDTAKERRLLAVPTVLGPSVTPVAFYAYLSTSENDPGHHHTIIFDHIITNDGNGYNQHTGAFTAPVDRVYAFVFTVASYPGHYLPVDFVLNSKVVGSTSADGRVGSSAYITATCAVTLSLQTGDICFVRTTTTSSSYVGNIYSHEFIRSSFAGWKLF